MPSGPGSGSRAGGAGIQVGEGRLGGEREGKGRGGERSGQNEPGGQSIVSTSCPQASLLLLLVLLLMWMCVVDGDDHPPTCTLPAASTSLSSRPTTKHKHRNQQYPAAQKWFSRALQLVPGGTITPAWEATVVNLAHTMRKQQQYAEALALYEQAIGLHPHNPASHIGLAYTHQLMGNSAAAVESYHKALGLRPDDAFAAEMLGVALKEECTRFGHMLMGDEMSNQPSALLVPSC